MQIEKYVGIPFVAGGRDYSGADCWGLARLFYKEELGVDLPSFSTEYTETDAQRMQELISQYREGWERTKEPAYGDLVLFKVLGADSHIGVYIDNNQFLHSMEKIGSAIQYLDSVEWKSRVVGFFKYSANTGAQLVAVPHPLRTHRVTTSIPHGTTVEELSKWVLKEYGISEELKQQVLIFVNGVKVEQSEWPSRVINDNDCVEYRALPGKSAFRLILTIAIAYAAFSLFGPQGTMALFESQVANAAFAAAVNLAGNLLLNAIMPIRMPEQQDPGQSKSQLLINGGQNQANKYGAIPVVLGRVRITGLHAANPYSNTSTDTANLKLLLCWGFGPLSVQDIRIGGSSISAYTNNYLTVEGRPDETQAEFDAVQNYYGTDTEQWYSGIKLANNGVDGGTWITHAFTQTCDKIDVTLHFPQGLRRIQVKGENAGAVLGTQFTGIVEYRRLDSVTGLPVSDWADPTRIRRLPYDYKPVLTAPKYTVSTNTDSEGGYYAHEYYFYQWNIIGIDRGGNIIHLKGTPSQSPVQEPDSSTLAVLRSASYGDSLEKPKLKPTLPNDVIPLVNICVKAVPSYEWDKGIGGNRRSSGYEITSTELTRPSATNYAYVGLNVDTSGVYPGYSYSWLERGVTITAGTVTELTSAFAISLGGVNEPFHKRKDAFSYTLPAWNVVPGRYEVRVRRTNNDEANPGGNEDFQNYHDAHLHTITTYSNRKPIIPPPNCKLALTAFDIRATDQINGNIEGINALVTTVALDYTGTNASNGTWVLQETNNPASLFRYILEHPASAQRVTDANTQLDLAALQDWHVFCDENNFTFNDVVTTQRSILEVLRDVCAAGRASPILRDGKWSVVIDRPQSLVVQHFTPHNSWGFESTKALPKQPDAFRIRYIEEALGYQENEILVYNVGKNETNSQLFEELQLPGVTNAEAASKHARWHLAQLKLRPETYTFNTDMEYLVCNRGDRVKVQHDVPMWGIGSARINNLRNNLLSHSESLENAYWTKRAGCTIVSNNAIAPDGTVTGDMLLDNGSQTSGFYIRPDTTLEDNIVYCSSIYFKEPSALVTSVGIDVYLKTSNSDMVRINYNTATGELTVSELGAGIIIDYGLDQDPSGWYRIWISYNSLSGTNTTGIRYLAGFSGTSAGNGLINIKFWGAMLEKTTRPSKYVQSTALMGVAVDLDEDMPIEATKSYAVRIRTDNGKSFVLRTKPYTASGYYNSFDLGTFTTSFSPLGSFTLTDGSTTGTIKELDLVLFGELNTESQDLVVLSIEPMDNNNARLTLVDYAPAIFSVDYSTDYQLPKFDPNITFTAKNLVNSITKVPVFTQVLSDESVLTVLSPGVFSVNIVAAIAPETGVSSEYFGIEVQAKPLNDSSDIWGYRQIVNIPVTGVKVSDVTEGEVYLIRARYLAQDGRVGPWTDTVQHTVIGKTSKPGSVTGLSYTVLSADGLLQLKWSSNGEPDLFGYEIRDVDYGWGDTGYLWQGAVTQADLQVPNVYTAKTYYIRAYDYSKNYSATSSTVTFTKQLPQAVTNISYSFGTTSNTSSNVVITWTPPAATQFQVSEFVLEVTKPGFTTYTTNLKEASYTMPADWLGNANITISVKDITGAVGTSAGIVIPKVAPNPVTNLRAEVVDNNVLMKWDLPANTTLPISHVLVKRGPTWVFPDRLIGEKDGTFTSIFELTGGTYTYWVAAVDTDGRESIPVSIVATVSQPPDFVFNGEYTSVLDGTMVNAQKIVNDNSVLMLVDTAETWASHFTTNSWAGPSAQVSAGYPFYSQPGTATASYSETFDLGTVVASSNITVSLNGVAIVGNPQVYVTIETRLAGGAWSSPYVGTSYFTSNFREIRVTVNVNRTSLVDQYILSGLSTRLDSKLVSDAGNVQALSTDTLGTVVNFSREFIDVMSITCTAGGTTPTTVVYDFKDSIMDATYSVTSNVCTVTTSATHGLEVGQNVRLTTTSGLGISGVYTIATKVSATVFTVSMTTSNTSGSATVYPESMRVYAFNNSGTRVSTPVSWSIRGY